MFLACGTRNLIQADKIWFCIDWLVWDVSLGEAAGGKKLH